MQGVGVLVGQLGLPQPRGQQLGAPDRGGGGGPQLAPDQALHAQLVEGGALKPHIAHLAGHSQGLLGIGHGVGAQIEPGPARRLPGLHGQDGRLDVGIVAGQALGLVEQIGGQGHVRRGGQQPRRAIEHLGRAGQVESGRPPVAAVQLGIGGGPEQPQGVVALQARQRHVGAGP
jgi:hypothetical protein